MEGKERLAPSARLETAEDGRVVLRVDVPMVGLVVQTAEEAEMSRARSNALAVSTALDQAHWLVMGRLQDVLKTRLSPEALTAVVPEIADSIRVLREDVAQILTTAIEAPAPLVEHEAPSVEVEKQEEPEVCGCEESVMLRRELAAREQAALLVREAMTPLASVLMDRYRSSLVEGESVVTAAVQILSQRRTVHNAAAWDAIGILSELESERARDVARRLAESLS